MLFSVLKTSTRAHTQLNQAAVAVKTKFSQNIRMKTIDRHMEKKHVDNMKKISKTMLPAIQKIKNKTKQYGEEKKSQTLERFTKNVLLWNARPCSHFRQLCFLPSNEQTVMLTLTTSLCTTKVTSCNVRKIK